MDEKQLDAFAAFADDLMKRVSALQAGTPTLIEETIKAREDLFTVVEPVAHRTGPLADDARAAHTACNALNEKILLLTTKVDGIVKVHRTAMDRVGYVGYKLSLVEEIRSQLTAEDRIALLDFQRAHRLAKAEWELYSSVAIMQLHSILGPYHELLLAFSGNEPGKHLDFQAAQREIGDKVADAAKDYLVFPFFAKLQKLIKVLLTPPAKKQAQELVPRVRTAPKTVCITQHPAPPPCLSAPPSVASIWAYSPGDCCSCSTATARRPWKRPSPPPWPKTLPT